MHHSYFLKVLLSLAMGLRARAEVHGHGAEGSIMGPVAFLWPDDRIWSASADNSGPCGSTAGVANRSMFPLVQGEVALSIADEAYKVAFYISFDNDPTSQSDFKQQILPNVAPKIEPGHQCYKIDPIPSQYNAGQNATIQLQYWADYDGDHVTQNETFYACADVTLVEPADFTVQVPCFNVTSATFDSSDGGSTATDSDGSDTASSTSSAPANDSDSLSKGAIAGIAVGTVVGSLAIVGAFAFALYRKRRSNKAALAATEQPEMSKKADSDAASVSTN